MDCDALIADSIKELDKKLDMYDIDDEEYADNI